MSEELIDHGLDLVDRAIEQLGQICGGVHAVGVGEHMRTQEHHVGNGAGVHRVVETALAQLRLNAAPIQTNTVHGVPYSQRLCTRGCVEAVDSESHLLFECGATAAAREFYWDALELADTPG